MDALKRSKSPTLNSNRSTLMAEGRKSRMSQSKLPPRHSHLSQGALLGDQLRQSTVKHSPAPSLTVGTPASFISTSFKSFETEAKHNSKNSSPEVQCPPLSSSHSRQSSKSFPREKTPSNENSLKAHPTPKSEIVELSAVNDGDEKEQEISLYFEPVKAAPILPVSLAEDVQPQHKSISSSQRDSEGQELPFILEQPHFLPGSHLNTPIAEVSESGQQVPDTCPTPEPRLDTPLKAESPISPTLPIQVPNTLHRTVSTGAIQRSPTIAKRPPIDGRGFRRSKSYTTGLVPGTRTAVGSPPVDVHSWDVPVNGLKSHPVNPRIVEEAMESPAGAGMKSEVNDNAPTLTRLQSMGELDTESRPPTRPALKPRPTYKLLPTIDASSVGSQYLDSPVETALPPWPTSTGGKRSKIHSGGRKSSVTAIKDRLFKRPAHRSSGQAAKC